MIVMIDNYDSFTYNVYQAMASLYNNIKVYSTPTASSNLLVRHTALLRRLSSHSAHSTHFPFSNRFLEVPY